MERYQYITAALNARQSDYTELVDLNVFITTYNVGGEMEDPDNFDTWIRRHDFYGANYDIIAIGLEEMVPLSATNVVGSAVASMSSERAAQWQGMILEYLNKNDATTSVMPIPELSSDGAEASSNTSMDDEVNQQVFSLVATTHMVGLFVAVFAKNSLLPSISNVNTASIACGAGNVLGNKGGVCIRMEVFDTSICFTCAHLAAHQNAVWKRNEDYNTIFTKNARDFLMRLHDKYCDCRWCAKIHEDAKTKSFCDEKICI
jgi:phosphatidylinositol-bisphosphatase